MSMGAKYLTYNKKDNQTKRPPDKKIIRQMTIRPNNNKTKWQSDQITIRLNDSQTKRQSD